MRTYIFAASIAAAALIPSIANAQQSCERQRSVQVAGTVVGAGAGALVGNSIAGRGDRTLGTVLGALGGAVLGNQITSPSRDCSHAYGYYDSDNRWHATGISSNDARGYYDRAGAWVDGAPNGYYDSSNRWIANRNMSGGDGFQRADGWVPASANGYYDRNDNWVAGSASGYYDERGRWTAGATTGRYDARGRWIAGQASGHRDANGAWIADPQPGYYDRNGRWNAGATTGYYDSRGLWIATVQDSGRREGQYQGRNRGDRDNERSVVEQISWLDQYVRSGTGRRSLSRTESNNALRELDAIRMSERRMGHDRRGNLSVSNESAIQLRLDRLTNRLHVDPS